LKKYQQSQHGSSSAHHVHVCFSTQLTQFSFRLADNPGPSHLGRFPWDAEHSRLTILFQEQGSRDRTPGGAAVHMAVADALLLSLLLPVASAISAGHVRPSRSIFSPSRAPIARGAAVEAAPSIFKNALVNTELKMRILMMAASLDRGQSYNPTSSDAYKERTAIATSLLRQLIASSPPLPTSLDALDGEWELVFTNVAHGIFRSSPFFLAIQQAYTDAGAPDKAELFFRLHELQTCSWGISKIGRVAQTIDSKNGMLYSEFDTNLLSLTTIPIIGFWKLLPTFGGSVITASSAKLEGDEIQMVVDYTTARPVPGLSGLRPLPGELGFKISEFIWNIKVPVGFVWKLLPWNKGPPACAVKLAYFDGDMRIVEDPGGQLFVYTRPVAPRPLPLPSPP
jgi:hypothetical protein